MSTTTPVISPLRQRMIEDMWMCKLAPKTQLGYIRAVRHFTGYLGRSPDTASAEDLRRYQLRFFGEHAELADPDTFAHWLAPLRQCEWVVYAKRPFAGPAAVLAYLSRYTHRVAISNRRLLALDERGVTFRW
jgi:hypothetical protein